MENQRETRILKAEQEGKKARIAEGEEGKTIEASISLQIGETV